MKKVAVVLVMVFMLTATCWAAGKGPEGQDVTMTGKISCTFCNLPKAGQCSMECCQNCIKSGDPVLFSDSKDNLYILLSGEHEKPLMTDERMKLLTQKVKIQGILVKRGGVQGIYVKSMEKVQ